MIEFRRYWLSSLPAQWLRIRSTVPSDMLCLFVIFVFFLPVSYPLWTRDLIGGVDLNIALIRVVGLIQCWREGLFLGRWIPDINFGYGYPLFNFYSPLFYYFAAALGWVLKDPVLGINIVLLTIYFLSAVTMYFFARDAWGRAGGFLSAVAYLYSPYHMWDVYARGACAEFLAYVFLPLVVFSLIKLYRKKSYRWFFAATFSIAGLLLSHNLMSAIFLPLAGGYILFLFIAGPSRHVKGFLLCVLAGVAALGLTAYFWMPMLLEQKYVTIEKLIGGEGFLDYHKHFLTLRQLLWDAWQLGQQRSHAFQLGGLHLALGVACLPILIKLFSLKREAVLQSVYWLVTGLFFGYMMLFQSQWIWESIPKLAYIQFPWRFFVILNFTLSFLIGGVVFWGKGVGRLVIAVVVAFLLVMVNFNYGKAVYGTTAVKVPDVQAWLLPLRPADSMEYMPRSVKRIPGSAPVARFEVIRGQADIHPNPSVPAAVQKVTIQSPTGALVCFHQFYFPGWMVAIDGKRVEILSNNDYGLIVFVVPAGEHSVTVLFGHTPARLMGEAISICVLIILGGAYLFGFKRRTSHHLPSNC